MADPWQTPSARACRARADVTKAPVTGFPGPTPELDGNRLREIPPAVTAQDSFGLPEPEASREACPEDEQP